MYKLITSKFPTKCSSTKKRIKRGDVVIFDVSNKRVYIPGKEPKEYNHTDDGRLIMG